MKQKPVTFLISSWIVSLLTLMLPDNLAVLQYIIAAISIGLLGYAIYLYYK